MKYDRNEDPQIKAQSCDQDADIEAVITEFDELFGDPDVDDDEISARDRTTVGDERAPDVAEQAYTRTVSIGFPRVVSVCHGVAGVEISVRDILSWLAASSPANAIALTEIRDGFFSDSEEDYCEPAIFDLPELRSPEARAEARVAHAKGETERLARRAAIEAEFARDDVEAARKEAEEAVKWAPFAEERTSLKIEEEALFDRADELDRRWEEFVIERET